MQVLELAQLGRDRAGQLVAAQIEFLQIDELAQLGRDRTGQPVAAQIQMLSG